MRNNRKFFYVLTHCGCSATLEKTKGVMTPLGGSFNENKLSKTFNNFSTFNCNGDYHSNGYAKNYHWSSQFYISKSRPSFIAMFISPVVAIAVSLGTGFGFLIRNTDYCFAGLISFDFCSHWRSDFTKHPEILINKEGNSLY